MGFFESCNYPTTRLYTVTLRSRLWASHCKGTQQTAHVRSLQREASRSMLSHNAEIPTPATSTRISMFLTIDTGSLLLWENNPLRGRSSRSRRQSEACHCLPFSQAVMAELKIIVSCAITGQVCTADAAIRRSDTFCRKHAVSDTRYPSLSTFSTFPH